MHLSASPRGRGWLSAVSLVAVAQCRSDPAMIIYVFSRLKRDWLGNMFAVLTFLQTFSQPRVCCTNGGATGRTGITVDISRLTRTREWLAQSTFSVSGGDRQSLLQTLHGKRSPVTRWERLLPLFICGRTHRNISHVAGRLLNDPPTTNRYFISTGF